MDLELLHFQVLSAALFSIGLYGVLARRSAVLILVSIELLLNAVNVNLIGQAALIERPPDERVFGQVLAIFIEFARLGSTGSTWARGIGNCVGPRP